MDADEDDKRPTAAERELRETKDALEAETRLLERLNQTGASLASNLDRARVVETVTTEATALAGAEFGAFFERGPREKSPGSIVFATEGCSPAARVAFASIVQPMLGPGVARITDSESPALRSCLAIPVVGQSGEVLGTLLLGHQDRDVFDERSERLAIVIAVQGAFALDNVRLRDDAKRADEERARLLEDERSARAEIERISLMKDEFLATLSHELRTPLNAMLGWSQILLSRPQHDAETRGGLEAIERNARAQAQLIEDLLDMNQIVAGKLRLDVQDVDLAAVVRAAIDTVRPSANAKMIRLRATLDPNAGPIFGDPSRLQQIAWNLLSNAVKFTPKGGNIVIDLRRVRSHVELTVQDSGSGIPASFLPHVFERFRQADSSTTRKYSGIGLGLSIVKQLVERHGGAIRAASPGENAGATFVVSVPLREIDERRISHHDHPGSRHAPTFTDSSISLSGIDVLLVDDVADARELLRLVLEEAGATVRLAASAGEGLGLLQTARPDVIVSDVGMPDADGYQFIRSVRSMGASTARIPAIALTAFARSEDRARAMIAGYQVHMAKPTEPQELIAAIKSLVDNARDG
ncbi:hypothetical protein BH09MYX1_BH09MYX1_60690 [soil metagenome]